MDTNGMTWDDTQSKGGFPVLARSSSQLAASACMSTFIQSQCKTVNFNYMQALAGASCEDWKSALRLYVYTRYRTAFPGDVKRWKNTYPHLLRSLFPEEWLQWRDVVSLSFWKLYIPSENQPIVFLQICCVWPAWLNKFLSK